MKGLIYKIVNKINGKVYIGQTIRSLDQRWKYHIYEGINQKKKTKIGRALRKYGIDNFDTEIVESTNNLNKREKYWISYYNSNKIGYNIAEGGDGGPHSESTKKKIAKANTKRIWTKKMRNNMSIAIKKWHKKRGFVPRSEEFKIKISIANSKRKMSERAKTALQNYNNSIKKPIVSLDTGKEYPSIMAACKELNLNDGHLRMHLKGRHNHVKGLRFKLK